MGDYFYGTDLISPYNYDYVWQSRYFAREDIDHYLYEVVKKNPPHNEPTCSIEDLREIENAFNKEGLTMEWSYDRAHLNGTLTFKW